MKQQQIIYGDLHFNNVFFNTQTKELAFIDTGAKKVHSPSKFEKKFTQNIRKFCKGSARELFNKEQIDQLTLNLEI